MTVDIGNLGDHESGAQLCVDCLRAAVALIEEARGTCRTCCHWTRSRIASKPQPLSRGKCDKAIDLYSHFDEGPSDGIFVDGEGYTPMFETGEDFSCIHWALRINDVAGEPPAPEEPAP